MVLHGKRALRGRDVTLWAAGLTFFAIIATVPMLLLLLRGAAVVLGEGAIVDRARQLGAALPGAHDVTAALDGLATAAVDASWLVLLTALLPASLYGEGLRRGLNQVADRPVTRLTGWAGRLGFLPVLVFGPALLALPLAFVPVVAPLYQEGGWSTVLGVVLSFHVDWVSVSVTVSLIVALTGPTVLPVRAALVAGFAIGAVLTGFLHGFLVFLAIPVDWSIPFGGLDAVGVVAALALWLFALHTVLLLGYRTALSTHRVHSADETADETRPDRKGTPDVDQNGAHQPDPRPLAR